MFGTCPTHKLNSTYTFKMQCVHVHVFYMHPYIVDPWSPPAELILTDDTSQVPQLEVGNFQLQVGFGGHSYFLRTI